MGWGLILAAIFASNFSCDIVQYASRDPLQALGLFYLDLEGLIGTQTNMIGKGINVSLV
jgi:hypothetical protein